MCESKSEGGRRCPGCMTDDARNRASRNRRLSREKRNNVVKVLQDQGLSSAAAAVKHSRPSDLAAIAVHMEARNPEIAAAMAEAVRGQFPGTHNMVMQDRRDSVVSIDRDNEDELRDNPHRLSAVQSAAVAVDRDLLNAGLVPAGQRAELAQSIQVREKAIDLGLLDGETMTLNKPLTPQQEMFLAATTATDMARLTALDDSVADKVFDHAFRHAKVAAEPRELYATPNSSISDALDGGAEVQIGEGVVARRIPPSDDFEGGYVLEVDGSPTRAGVTLPVSPNDEVEDVMSRIPKITSITDDAKENAPMGQSSLYERALNPKSPTGQATLRALERSLIDAAYNGDRSGGITRRRSASDPQKLIDRVREGKSPRLGNNTLVGTGHRTGDPSTPRHEGYLVGGLIRRQDDARDKAMERVAKAKGVALSPDTTVGGNKRAKVSRVYRGTLDEGQRKAAEQSGFKPRSDNPKTGPDSRVTQALAGLSTPVVPDKLTAQNVIGRHGPSGKTWTDAEVERLAATANRAARHGANPETTSVDVAVAAADLSRDAKAARAGAIIQGVAPVPVTGVATQTIPTGVPLDQLFPVGGPVETKGYQVIGGTKSSRAPRAVRGGNKPVEFVYTASSAVSYAGTSTAVVPDGTTMRVSHVDDSGPVPRVYLIEQDTLIDGKKA